MRKLILVLTGIAVLAVVNYSIYQKEQLLAHGRPVFLELAPVDPRSLMQGDYMALRFRLQDSLSGSTSDGYVVAARDERGVATFVRVDNGAPLSSGELRIRYRVRAGAVKLGTNAFFFQEGQGVDYQKAKYGEARVDEGGNMLLTALRDQDLNRLGPPPALR